RRILAEAAEHEPRVDGCLITGGPTVKHRKREGRSGLRRRGRVAWLRRHRRQVDGLDTGRERAGTREDAPSGRQRRLEALHRAPGAERGRRDLERTDGRGREQLDGEAGGEGGGAGRAARRAGAASPGGARGG